MFVINVNPIKAVVAIPPKKIMPRVEILIPEVHFSPSAAVDAPTISGSSTHGHIQNMRGGNSNK